MKPGKDNLHVGNNSNNDDDDDLHPNVWVFNSHPLLCSGIHGSWWALTDWEFRDFASSLCSASFIPRQIRNWTHHLEVPLHICMHIRNSHHISQNFWLGSITWLVGWGTGEGDRRRGGLRVTVLASSQVQPLPLGSQSCTSPCCLPCVLVQCIWPQRAKQNPRQLSPIASGKEGKTRGEHLMQSYPQFLYIFNPASWSQLPLLRRSYQANSASCFQASHLTRRPPQTHPKGTNTFLERHRCLEGCPKPLQEIGGTEANFLVLFSSRCCLGRYLCRREGINSARRWAAGEWPSVNNQFHVNLLELQVRRAHLQGAPLPSIHTGAASQTAGNRVGTQRRKYPPSVWRWALDTQRTWWEVQGCISILCSQNTPSSHLCETGLASH